MSSLSPVEQALREQIMNALADRMARNGGVVTRDELTALPVGGRQFRVIDQSRGIWNPSWLEATLTIVSSPDGPYNDTETEGGLLRYDYRAGSTEGDNRKLRVAIALGAPMILLRKIASSVYLPIFPVYAVQDDVENHQFVIALDESLRFLGDPLRLSGEQRRYADRIVRQRLHQPEFRAKVIRAYSSRCTICTLRRSGLLDAAHIVRDRDDWGDPVVPNGLSLCKIHHAAYDQDLIGVSPDYEVHVNRDLLLEEDGPMLEHGLQEMNGRHIVLPQHSSLRPDRDRLAARYEAFLAGG